MNKYLVVYNICEIQNENFEWYKTCIDSLLKQDYQKYHILVSGCRVTKETQKKLYDLYKGKVSFFYTDLFLSVNITFNKAVDEAVKKYGTFDGYIYVDSGVDFEDNPNIINEIDDRFKTDEFSMVTLQTDTDHGHHWFLPYEQHVKDPYIRNEDFIMPLGRTCNLHVTCFSEELRLTYKRIVPDIFNAYCTESVFSFLNSALRKKWVIIKDIILTHEKSTDGATLSHDHTGDRDAHWNNNYGGLDMVSIITDKEVIDSGLGYEEITGILNHKKDQYDSDSLSINPKLKEIIRDKLFLTPDRLDYNFITHQFITV